MINVASVEQHGWDGITIMLLGQCGSDNHKREFRGVGLKQIHRVLASEGIEVVAYLVDCLPWQTVSDLPLVVRHFR